MKSLATAFKEVYGEALKEYGFKKVKGKYPYYARMVGDEIVQVITFATRPKQREGYKEYIVLGGVATVYRHYINLNSPVIHNFDWLQSNLEFYEKSNAYMEAREYDDAFRKWYTSSYKETSVEDLLESMSNSLEVTKKYMMPVLNNITDLESCYDYFQINNSPILRLQLDENFGQKFSTGESNEGLICFKLFDAKQNIEKEQYYFDEFKKQLRHSVKIGKGINDVESMLDMCEKSMCESNKKFKDALDDPSEISRINAELDRRKQANIELLINYEVMERV